MPRQPRPAPHGVLGVGRRRPTRACWSACTACRARAATSTRWRARCAADYRVVCPDVVGRGRSPTGSPTRSATQIPAYVADMVTLLARLDARARALGRHLDGRADRPRPGGAAGLADRAAGAERRRPGDRGRGARAHRQPTSASRCTGTRVEEAADYLRAISAGFGPHTPRAVAGADAADARRPTAPASSRTTTRRSRVPFRAITPRAGGAPARRMLWQAYDAIALPDAAAARRRVRPAVARDRARR